MKGYKITVHGRVQGVGFRWYAKRVADTLGIDGSVRNMEDGTVLIKCLCDEELMKQFVNRLKQGNTMFRRVERVVVEEEDPDVLGIEKGQGFVIVF